jgi:sulfate adenylyltransferase
MGEMQKIALFPDFVYDAEKIGIGAYSPLDGFMDEETFGSVVSDEKLPDGLPWTIPIVLAPAGEENEKVIQRVSEGGDLSLLDSNGNPFAILHLKEKYMLDKDAFAKGAYGTADVNHPNVYDIFNNYGETALAGKVELVRRLDLPTGEHELTPHEIRKMFETKGWRHVVAYQCRNPPHTAHEYLQRCSLESADVDGLFIHPVVGRLKKGDYKPDVIMRAYKALVENYYPPERVFLSSLSITMRYGGPKAALFLAIVRKNYGATHYIVGRDQAGIGEYYDPYACHRIFGKYQIGIVPLRYMETFYCRRCGWMANEKTCPHASEDRVAVSQTRLRQMLKEGKELPREILRPEVVEVLSKGDVVLA